MREYAGGAPAGPRTRLCGRPAASRPDQQPAMRASQRVMRPVLGHVLLDKQETMRAIGLIGLCFCGGDPHPLQRLSPLTRAGKRVPRKRFEQMSTVTALSD